MLQYEFETVEAEARGYSLMGGVGPETQGHQEIILRRAAAGWRYVGCIPARQRGEGYVTAFDLIFEQDTPEA